MASLLTRYESGFINNELDRHWRDRARLAVMTGAFGAHGLRGKLDDYSMGVYEKAVFYHFLHGLGLLIIPILARVGVLANPQPPASAGCLPLGY